MKALSRVVMMAEMHGRDLVRRHAALGLLVALPLSFYLASAGDDSRAPVTGGIGMSFAVSGAALFSIMSARAVDQRLVLAGYRPLELLLGRVAFLGPLALSIAAGFAVLMARLSHPARIWIVVLGLATVALHHGLALSLQQVRDFAYTDRQGATLLDLLRGAETLGFSAMGVRANFEHLTQIPLPAIAHVRILDNLGHYVVVHRVRSNRVTIALLAKPKPASAKHQTNVKPATASAS
jgi:predicted nucleic acid-binding protein